MLSLSRHIIRMIKYIILTGVGHDLKTIAGLLCLKDISNLLVLSAGCLGKDNIITGVRYCSTALSLGQCQAGTLAFLKTYLLDTYDRCSIFKKSAEIRIAGLCLLDGGQSDMEEYRLMADKYSVPLLFCEDYVPLEELTRRVAYALWDIPSINDNTINNQDISIDLIDQPDIYSLLAKLSEFIKCSIAYRDVLNDRTYVSSQKYEFIENVKTFPLKELERLFKCFWVIDEEYKYGCLILEENITVPSNTIKAALLGLKLLVRTSIQDQIKRKKHSASLFKELIDGRIDDQSTLLQKLRSIGIRKDYPCITMIFEPLKTIAINNTYRLGLLISDIENKIAPFFNYVSITYDEKEIVCIGLLNEMPKNYPDFANENIIKAISLLNKELTSNINENMPHFIGISDIRTTLLELNKSNFAARHALLYSKINNIKDAPVFWNQLGGFKILCNIAYRHESINLYNNVLKKVIDYDKSHHCEMIKTLMELDKNNWNFKTTSEKLMFHQNTIKYRYRKICELIGTDNINDHDFRFDMDLALRLHSIYMMSDHKKEA